MNLSHHVRRTILKSVLQCLHVIRHRFKRRKWWSAKATVIKPELTPDDVCCTWLMSRHWSRRTEPPRGTEEVDRGLTPWGAVRTRVTSFTVGLRLSCRPPRESTYMVQINCVSKNNTDFSSFLSLAHTHTHTGKEAACYNSVSSAYYRLNHLLTWLSSQPTIMTVLLDSH